MFNIPYDFKYQNGVLFFQIAGNITSQNASFFLSAFTKNIKKSKPVEVVVELRSNRGLDEYGALLLSELERMCNSQRARFSVNFQHSESKDYFTRFQKTIEELPASVKNKSRMGPVERLGDAGIKGIFGFGEVVVFAGDAVLSMFNALFKPKMIRWDDTISLMSKTGIDAVPIVALISFLLGLIMAFMSSIQLQQFGADIYVASLVTLAMVSELGPIMTAIVVAGRSGSAFAAEIATMKISEEIDALFIMGFNATIFLAVPRMVASMIVVPILSLFSNIFAIAGGLVVGVFMLNLTPTAYMDQTLKTLKLFDVMWGLMKSGVFAALIAWVGCLRGFQARGGASAVGNAATSAVVTSIFLIILFDSAFAVIRSYW